MQKKIRDAVLIVNRMKDSDLVCFNSVLSVLNKLGIRVRIQKDLAGDAKGVFEAYSSEEELYSGADAVILLGGDGTFLSAAPLAIKNDVLMLGINLGRTGYMAELAPTEIHMLERLASGDYEIEERMTLSVYLENNGAHTLVCQNAINEIAVQSAFGLHCIELVLYCDGSPVHEYRGNGLVISTPTGSTAYSMSAGGPVLDPTLRCLSIVPVCSVSPQVKPLVFSGENVMTVENVCKLDERVSLNVDGKISTELSFGARVICTASDRPCKMIKIKDDKFFAVLRAKIK